MNFKAKYCADMRNIRPGEQLLASVKELAHAKPKPRRTGYYAAATLSAAVLLLAIAMPFMLPEKPAEKLAALSDYSPMTAQNDDTVKRSVPEFVPEYNDTIQDGLTKSVDTLKESMAADGAKSDEVIFPPHEDMAITSCRAFPENSVQLSADELAEQAEYADYLPTVLPQGFALEFASLEKNADDNTQTLYADWTDGGYDYLTLLVRPFTEADKERLADIDQTETWNRSFYGDVPLCDTPQELWPTLDCPIFLPNDLDETVIAGRAAESDQNAKYIRFGIKYGDYLLEYTAHTADVEGVWQAVSSTGIFIEN